MILKHDIIITSANETFDEIIINLIETSNRSKKYKSIRDIIMGMRYVESITPIEIPKHKNTKSTRLFATNNIRLILDVDSTITRRAGIIHHSIPPILKKIQDKGIWIYIATGRSIESLSEIIRQNPTIQRNSIAENGGIILGFTHDGYLEWGNKEEPRKVLEYLQKHYTIKEDMEQGERITEVIFLQDDVTEDQIKRAIKSTKAKVAVHKSQNSYHISAKDIDKGSAILKLADKMKWGTSYKIAVGDSQLDVPMFKACEYSFAPKNSDEHAKAACSKILHGSYEKCLKEIYEIIEKSQ